MFKCLQSCFLEKYILSAFFCLFLFLLIFNTDANSQSYPVKPISLIVPFPTGGGTDFVTRIFAEKLSKNLGVPVTLDNRAGAGGMIGTEFVSRSEPNGYTFVIGSISTICINASIYTNQKFNPIKDLLPISLIATTPSIIAVPFNFPADSLHQLLALIKSKPNYYNFGSAGSGSSHHLAGELLNRTGSIDLLHVPFKGTSPALIALIRGDVHVLISNIPSLMPGIKNKQIKPLAVTSLKRSHLLPDLPTANESGLPGFNVTIWYGIFAPLGTPESIISLINSEIKKITEMDDVKNRLSIEGAESMGSSQQELKARILSDFELWNDIVKKAIPKNAL